ncbi:hypothetical protein Tco_0912106, partial [Tanacetum coccineum]
MGDENPISTLGDYSKPSPRAIRIPSSSPKGTTWTAKLRNDILMFQQHHGESLSKAWTRFKDLLQKVPHHGIDLWLQIQIFYDHVNPITRRTIDQLAGDVPSTSDRRLIELKNQVQRLMKAHLALTKSTQVNKITTPCEICSGPHDTQNCMENPEQAFVEYASSRTDEAGEGLVFEFMASRDARLSKFEVDFKQQQSKMTNKIDIVLKAITDRIAGTLPSDTVTDISKMDKNKAKMDKSEHEIGRVCSWRGGPFNGRNYRCCTNVSFGDEFVCNPDPISNDETPDFGCGDPLEDGVRCQHGTCKWCGYNLRGGFCLFCTSRDGNSSIDAPNLNSFDNPPDFSYQPPQHQPETYSCELCGNDSHYGYDCPPRFPL